MCIDSPFLHSPKLLGDKLRNKSVLSPGIRIIPFWLSIPIVKLWALSTVFFLKITIAQNCKSVKILKNGFKH